MSIPFHTDFSSKRGNTHGEYKQKRGFYIPLDSIPGRIVKDGKKLYEELINEYNDFDKEKIVEFSKHYMGKCDGNSTQRLFDMIINDFN